MITLEQILYCLNQGVKADPYFYRIVLILDVFDARNNEKLVSNLRKGIKYHNIEDIPKEYYNRQLHSIEPVNDDNGALSLRIVLL